MNYSKTKISETNKRDNLWLQEIMYELWENHFDDIPRKNLVLAKFGRSTKRQLGSIKWATPKTQIKKLMKSKEILDYYENQEDKRITVITITKKFQDDKIPQFIILATLAHELCHYAHGFHSPLKQKYRYPHQGNIIKKELHSRDLGSLYDKSQIWIKNHWQKFI